MKSAPELVLVLGIDGSGKSTMLKTLEEKLGYQTVEATSTKEAKEFKASHFGRALDSNLIRRRQHLFRGINSVLSSTISLQLSTSPVATSGSRLVTDISHNTMLGVVEGRADTTSQIVDGWKTSDDIKPDKIVLLHAPMDEIRNRILARQNSGALHEEMTGFNSAFFLGHYQDALHEVVDVLAADTPTLKIDTSQHPPSSLAGLFEVL